MRIEAVTLSNVRVHEEFHAQFGPGVVLLLGPNEVGKTSVLQGIGWALFDSLPFKQADYIRYGAKEAEVEVCFTHAGNSWRVYRSTREGMRVWDGRGKPVASGKRDSLAVIRGALGLEEGEDLVSLYKDALAPPQGQLVAGFALSPAARKDFWGPVLRLDSYRRAWEKLRAPARILEERVVGGEAKVDALSRSVALLGATPENLDDRLTGCMARLEKVTEALVGAEERIGETREALERETVLVAAAEERARRLRDYQKRLVQVEGDLAGLVLQDVSLEEAQLERVRSELEPDVHGHYEATKEELVRAEAALIGVRQSVGVAAEEVCLLEGRWERAQAAQERSFDIEMGLGVVTTKLEVLRAKMVRLLLEQDQAETTISVLAVGEPCPTCGADLSDAQILSLLVEQHGIVDSAQQCIPELEVSVREAIERQGLLCDAQMDVEVVLASAPSERGLREEHEHLVQAKKEAEYLEGFVEKCRGVMEELKPKALKQQELEAELVILECALALLEQKNQGVTLRRPRLEKEREELGGEIVALAGKTEVVEGALARLQGEVAALDAECLSLRAEKAKLEGQLDNLLKAQEVQAEAQEVERDLERDGGLVRVLSTCRQAISDAGPLVAEGLMRSLSVLAADYWQQMGKDTVLRWAGDFSLSAGNQGFHQLSGGAQVAAALAARLAVARHQADLGWICLDEPSIHLDAQVREALANVLARLRLEQLILVSHDPIFESCANQVVRL